MFSLYPGVGRVFAVTVTYIGEPTQYAPVSAYVPAISYGCDLSLEGDCQTLSIPSFSFGLFFSLSSVGLFYFMSSPLGSTFGKVLCALSLFVGLFMAFAGHRYFQIEMLMVGFATFSTISYIILVNRFDSDVTGT